MSVAEELRKKRDFVIIFVVLGLLLAMGLGAAFGEAVMWLWIVLMTVIVIVQLRIRCPYCGHLIQLKKTGTSLRENIGGSYTSPRIWDYCPGCHRDLTIPFDPNQPSPLDERGERTTSASGHGDHLPLHRHNEKAELR